MNTISLQEELEMLKKIYKMDEPGILYGTEEIKIPSIDFESLLQEREIKSQPANWPTKPEKIQIGQVWQVKPRVSDIGPDWVIITVVQGNEYFGVPISEEWHFAAEHDLVIRPNGGLPNGFGDWHLIQLWAETGIMPETLYKFWGEVSAELFTDLQTALASREDSSTKRVFEGSVREESQGRPFGPTLYRFTITNPFTGKEHGLLFGQKILHSDDPRLEFRRMEQERRSQNSC